MSTFDDFARDQTDQSVDLATQARHLAYLRSLPARPEAVSVKTRSAVIPAAAIASCCWSMDCWPVETRR